MESNPITTGLSDSPELSGQSAPGPRTTKEPPSTFQPFFLHEVWYSAKSDTDLRFIPSPGSSEIEDDVVINKESSRRIQRRI